MTLPVSGEGQRLERHALQTEDSKQCEERVRENQVLTGPLGQRLGESQGTLWAVRHLRTLRTELHSSHPVHVLNLNLICFEIGIVFNLWICFGFIGI